MTSINVLLQQEKTLRREFYTANYNSDKVAVELALKQLEAVLYQQRREHIHT